MTAQPLRGAHPSQIPSAGVLERNLCAPARDREAWTASAGAPRTPLLLMSVAAASDSLPCARAIPRTMDSPSPVPPRGGSRAERLEDGLLIAGQQSASFVGHLEPQPRRLGKRTNANRLIPLGVARLVLSPEFTRWNRAKPTS